MTERELFDCLGKNVKIIFKDGQILEGFCEGFDTENDNAPRKASIDIRQKNSSHCVVAFANEIEKIELTDN